MKRLRTEGHWVRAADLKKPEFSESKAHEFIIGDLRVDVAHSVLQDIDEVYQLAADMGGAGYIFTALRRLELHIPERSG